MKRLPSFHREVLPCLAVALLNASSLAASDAGAAEFSAGAFSFSDELGGFRLISARGVGTPADPVVIVEEIDEAAPVTLVIRRRPRRALASYDSYASLTLIKIVVNRSLRVWAGFEVELQEILRKPSVYGDGLSFKQFGSRPPDASSNAFADNDRQFEPYDRIRFENGFVDPEATARFKLTITDPTPVPEFYLVQDPQLLSAQLSNGRAFALRLDQAASSNEK